MEGVLEVEVSCTTGTAVCSIRPGTAPAGLLEALDGEGFDATVRE